MSSWLSRTASSIGSSIGTAIGGVVGSVFGAQRDVSASWWAQLMPPRSQRAGRVTVSAETALRHSAVWASLRLRADLTSAMPVDVYRKVQRVQVEVTPPGWLVEPAPGMSIGEWLWATQFDLDRFGNCFGLVTRRDAFGRVAEVELLSATDVSVITRGRRITGYRVAGEGVLDPSMIWHERQYWLAGSPIGLSPIAYAAYSVGGYLSAQDFALDWYSSGAAPSGHLRYLGGDLGDAQAEGAKRKFRESVQNRDVLVSGKNWEWTPAQGDANSTAFLDEMKYGIVDVCRFLGVPADMLDGDHSRGNITYANVTQRNLQLLVVNMGPAVKRREDAFTRVTPAPWYVKLNANAAVLKMDPQTRAATINSRVAARLLTPTEAREIDDLPPLTSAQIDEFNQLYGAPRASVPVAAELPAAAGRGYNGWALPDARIDARIDPDQDARHPLAITSGWRQPDGRGA